VDSGRQADRQQQQHRQHFIAVVVLLSLLAECWASNSQHHQLLLRDGVESGAVMMTGGMSWADWMADHLDQLAVSSQQPAVQVSPGWW
jgi:Na+/H+ antiporter NhaC